MAYRPRDGLAPDEIRNILEERGIKVDRYAEVKLVNPCRSTWSPSYWYSCCVCHTLGDVRYVARFWYLQPSQATCT